MKGDRDKETSLSTPNPQYSPVTSEAPTPFSASARSPFDQIESVREVEDRLIPAVLALPGSEVGAIALLRVDTYRNCLVGRQAARAGDSSPGDPIETDELSKKICRIRFSIEDTELGPVAAMVAALGGETVEDPGSGFETEDPAELVKVLGAGPWSYWTVPSANGPLGVLCISGSIGTGIEEFELLLQDVGRALERTETRSAWDRMARQQRRLRDGAVTVCSSRNLTELYRRLIRLVARGTSAPWARILGGAEADPELRVLAQCGAVPESPGFEAALQEEARPAWETLRPRFWSGHTGDADSPPSGPVWLIPVQAFDQALGILAVGRLADELAGDMDRDEPFLQSVAGQFALAIRNSQIGEELRLNRQRMREIQGQLLRSERMATLGETAAELAGQSRPMVSSIYESVREVLESLDETDKNAGPVENVCRELLRLDALLRDQVDLARLTQPRLVMSELGSLVGECIDSIRDDAQLAGVRIGTQVGSDLPQLLLDHEKVREVVSNLLRTALNGLERGDRLSVETKKAGHHLLMEVTAARQPRSEDSEAPISIESSDLLTRLFSSFASAQAGGSTLGLGVARQIVVDHGGELDIRREGSRSFVYRLRLPIRDNRDRRFGKDRRNSDRRRAA